MSAIEERMSHAPRRSIHAVIRRIRELVRTASHPAEGELWATARSLAARRRSGEDSNKLFSEILVTCAGAVRLVTGQVPANDVIAAGAYSALGVVPFVPAGNGRRAALAMAAYWHATAGEGVHVMVATEQEAGPVKAFLAQVLDHLGSSVGLVSSGDTAAERRSAYSADVTVGSCGELSADFLRDNLHKTVADTVQRRVRRLVVADVGEMLLTRAREQHVVNAPFGIGLPVEGVELAAKLRSGIDYLPDSRQRAVHIAAAAMAQIKASVGWDDPPVPQAVARAMAVEKVLVHREGLAESEGRQVIADISLRGYVREYPIVTGFAGKPHTDGARLSRLYGIDAASLRSPLMRLLDAQRVRRAFDEEEMAFEELYDAQRRTIYDLRRRVRDKSDPDELARQFVVDLARLWSTQGMSVVEDRLAFVLRRNTFEFNKPKPVQLKDAATETLTSAMDELERSTASSERRRLIRSKVLDVVDAHWREHIARARFLQRQAPGIYAASHRLLKRKRDLDHIFAGSFRAIKEDSLRYILSLC